MKLLHYPSGISAKSAKKYADFRRK